MLAIEGVALSLGIRGVSPGPSAGAGAAWLEGLHTAQGWLFRFLIAFGSSLAILIFASGAESIRGLAERVSDRRVELPWLIVHLILLASLVAISERLGAGPTSNVVLSVAATRPVLALAAAGALFAAFAPFGWWREFLRDRRRPIVYAFLMAIVAVLAIDLSHTLWAPVARITFDLVRLLLSPLYPHLYVDPASLSLATDRFGVIVTDYCSGLEGVGLMLVFCAGWLWCFRDEYRFPRALLIVPIATTIIFLLNSVRIAALLMIGDAGHPRIASAGFHSQAGWIAFNLSAFFIAVVSKRSRWLTRVEARRPESAFENPVTPYLLPLAVLLAIGMVTRVLSSDFEPLYPLRVAGVLSVLWYYRGVYRKLDWRISVRAMGTGSVIFIAWVLIARTLLASQPLPAVLAHESVAARAAWIAARIAGAIVTVPLAEELAYRGFLMRRLANRNFDRISFRDVGWPALAISAAAFGLAHGALWFPAILAGLAYGWLAIRSGRFGEAVAAHAVTNAWLAMYVLIFDQWQLW